MENQKGKTVDSRGKPYASSHADGLMRLRHLQSPRALCLEQRQAEIGKNAQTYVELRCAVFAVAQAVTHHTPCPSGRSAIQDA